MESLLAVQGQDFVLTASSSSAVRGITVLKPDDDKSQILNSHNLMLYCGEAGDTTNFAEYIAANISLYTLRHNLNLSPEATASFTRKQLATSLRSRKPYQVNILLAGYETNLGKPELFWLDYLATCVRVPYACQGYSSFYCLSIFDRYYKPDLTIDEAVRIMKLCFDELKKRMPIDFKGFICKVVDKDGIREINI
ncbi:putative proteasome subunit beta type-4 [Schizosaccharomyces pombe]|uniref:Probable proteasome subunit beta type-4 n=1 Tax=Schizosaccharomyces pombe (strain 972 / ATCC 24843) TaxID=284812 RepID=PSB4_SCHPO|nr:putative proteasome core particle subunit beta 4 [Schizosaccharomyces pombe]Q09720.1 RecName: Full=Probable proteasome subunit beta type-4 [Schizosaccharomyces pombe 972h-]CAA90462.1 20S proteasome component beta 4 (predicted) [Schizosaccharomyces pombe]|eukprot:NP_592916.1 putative proteasome core particle subunit beta 4 [Schizosaccharomyces pombe]